MQPKRTTHFGIQRKIVANMTSESWETIPHVTYMYEPDVTDFMREYKKLNLNRRAADRITVNTLLLKTICMGLQAAPNMNAHLHFRRKLVRGTLETFSEIDISMPMLMPNGEMMTVKLPHCESKNLDEISECVRDLSRRAAQSDLQQAMYEVSLDNTLTALRAGKIAQTVFRVIGSKTGRYKVKTLHGKAKREYTRIPATERLTKADLEPGTVTVSNVGSNYRGQKGALSLLEIVPPQVCAFGVGAVQDKPVVITDAFGRKQVEARQVLPICIAFDHRALDFGDIVPFLQTLDAIFENPKVIHTWVRQTGAQISFPRQA